MMASTVKASSLEASFLTYWSIVHPAGVPDPEREIRFHPTRKWRLDFGWPAVQLAVELQGTSYAGTHHQRSDGLHEDCLKLNAAQLLGWTVLLYTSIDLRKRPVQVIEEVAGEWKKRSQGSGIRTQQDTDS